MAKTTKSKRAKQFKLWLTSSRRLVITLKRTRSRSTSRAKTHQLRLPLPLPSVKELDVKLQKGRLKKAVRMPKLKITRQTLSSIIFLVIGLAGTVYFGMSIRHTDSLDPTNQFALYAPTPDSTKKKPDTVNVGMSRSAPTHIKVPSVGINANVGSVGRQADGSMEVPNDPYLTGWYKYSPTPGEIGPAIIVGHVDWRDIGPAVFYKLRDLKPGAKIIITRKDGSKATFKVTGLQQFEQNNFPTKKVYGNTSNSALRLITCGGTFNYQTDHYSHNTVVFATLVTKA